jgi:hypothetical protein
MKYFRHYRYLFLLDVQLYIGKQKGGGGGGGSDGGVR